MHSSNISVATAAAFSVPAFDPIIPVLLHQLAIIEQGSSFQILFRYRIAVSCDILWISLVPFSRESRALLYCADRYLRFKEQTMPASNGCSFEVVLGGRTPPSPMKDPEDYLSIHGQVNIEKNNGKVSSFRNVRVEALKPLKK